MNKIKVAKIKYEHNSFTILEEGEHVICAVSKKIISIRNLNYWNVELQEAYFSPTEVQIRYEQMKKDK